DGAPTFESGSTREDHATAPWGALSVFLLATAWVVLRTLSFWWAAQRVGGGAGIPAVLLAFGDLPTLASLSPEPPPLALFRSGKEKTRFEEAYRNRRTAVRWGLGAIFFTISVGYFLVSCLRLIPAATYGTMDSPARAVIAALSGFALGLAAFTGLAAPLARPTLDNKDPKEERSLGRALAKLGLYGALVAGGLGAVVAVRFFCHSDPANLSINALLSYHPTL